MGEQEILNESKFFTKWKNMNASADLGMCSTITRTHTKKNIPVDTLKMLQLSQDVILKTKNEWPTERQERNEKDSKPKAENKMAETQPLPRGSTMKLKTQIHKLKDRE